MCGFPFNITLKNRQHIFLFVSSRNKRFCGQHWPKKPREWVLVSALHYRQRKEKYRGLWVTIPGWTRPLSGPRAWKNLLSCKGSNL